MLFQIDISGKKHLPSVAWMYNTAADSIKSIVPEI